MNMTSFYQNRNFFGERGRPIYRIPSRRSISFYGPENILQHKVMSFFDIVQFERFGRLSGEYLLDQNGLILIDESHNFIMINNSWEDVVSRQVSDYVYNRDNQGHLLDALGSIKTMEVVQDCQILAHPYSHVYFHFIGDMLPSLRFFDGLNDAPVLLDNGLLERSYQKQYLGRALGGKNVIPFSAPVRVIDPWLAHSHFSDEAIGWLRQRMGFKTRSGPRRVYIKKRRITRVISGGGISESPEFLQFLDDHGFETIDFGDGSTSIDDQVELINNAHIVLYAHSSGGTNCMFLNGNVNIIEVTGPQIQYGIFAYMACVLGFHYHGVTSLELDADGDIVVDMAILQDVIRAIES